jgi:hypothetical protein
VWPAQIDGLAGLATVAATVGSLNAIALVAFTHCSALADCNTGLDVRQWHQLEQQRFAMRPATQRQTRQCNS